MKKFIVFTLAFVICLGLFACKNNEQSGDKFVPQYKELTVMSFNIRIFGFEDQQYKLWENRKEDVIALILRHNPDIIGFQEVKDPQYNYLIENLTEYGHYGINGWTDSPIASLMGGTNAVFYKKDRFELTDSRTLWLSDTPEVRSGWESDIRTLTKVKFIDKLNKETFTFINTHLAVTMLGQHNGTKMLADMAEQTEGGLIITGDFNYQQDTDDYKIMVEGKLKDAMVMSPDTDMGGTFHGFNGKINTPWPKPIDFIFITDSCFEPQSYKIIRDSNDKGRYPSDHFPIKAVISYKEKDK